jgi:hypothetical protein
MNYDTKTYWMSPALISMILMLTVAPIIACITLVALDSSRWGDPNLLSVVPTILVMAAFGLITVSLWPTFIPALLITPLAMNRFARTHIFQNLPVSVLLGIAFFVGAVGGILIFTGVIYMSRDDSQLAMSWAASGAVSGAVTLCAIFMVYRSRTGPLPLPVGDESAQ